MNLKGSDTPEQRKKKIIDYQKEQEAFRANALAKNLAKEEAYQANLTALKNAKDVQDWKYKYEMDKQRQDLLDPIKPRSRFVVGGVERGRARSREVMPEDRAPQLNPQLIPRDKLIKPVAQPTIESRKRAEYEKKTDRMMEDSRLAYLLNGNKAQRLLGQQILEQRRLDARNLSNDQLLQRQLEIERERNKHALDLANLETKRLTDLKSLETQSALDLANVDAANKLALANIDNGKQSNINLTNQEIARINAQAQTDVAQIGADTQSNVNLTNQEIARINAQAQTDVAQMNANAANEKAALEALAASTPKQMTQKEINEAVRLIHDIETGGLKGEDLNLALITLNNSNLDSDTRSAIESRLKGGGKISSELLPLLKLMVMGQMRSPVEATPTPAAPIKW